MSDSQPEATDNAVSVGHLYIDRQMTDDGDTIYTTWNDDASLIELLGMVELARDTVLRRFRDREDDEDDEA